MFSQVNRLGDSLGAGVHSEFYIPMHEESAVIVGRKLPVWCGLVHLYVDLFTDKI